MYRLLCRLLARFFFDVRREVLALTPKRVLPASEHVIHFRADTSELRTQLAKLNGITASEASDLVRRFAADLTPE